MFDETLTIIAVLALFFALALFLYMRDDGNEGPRDEGQDGDDLPA